MGLVVFAPWIGLSILLAKYGGTVGETWQALLGIVFLLSLAVLGPRLFSWVACRAWNVCRMESCFRGNREDQPPRRGRCR
jgi:hypothetical protein